MDWLRDVKHWRLDINDERIRAALTWSCDVCKAPIATLCTNTCQPGQKLPGRIVHYAREVDRRR